MFFEGDYIFEYCNVNGFCSIKLYNPIGCSNFVEYKIVEVEDLFASFVHYLLDSGSKENIVYLKIRKLDNNFSYGWNEIF